MSWWNFTDIIQWTDRENPC